MQPIRLCPSRMLFLQVLSVRAAECVLEIVNANVGYAGTASAGLRLV